MVATGCGSTTSGSWLLVSTRPRSRGGTSPRARSARRSTAIGSTTGRSAVMAASNRGTTCSSVNGGSPARTSAARPVSVSPSAEVPQAKAREGNPSAFRCCANEVRYASAANSAPAASPVTAAAEENRTNARRSRSSVASCRAQARSALSHDDPSAWSGATTTAVTGCSACSAATTSRTAPPSQGS